jgi:hypothetical protein
MSNMNEIEKVIKNDLDNERKTDGINIKNNRSYKDYASIDDNLYSGIC